MMLRIALSGMMILCLATAARAEGPLHVRNQFPPHLMFLKPVPDTPSLLPRKGLKISVSSDYAAVFINETSENWAALIDMEMTVLNFSLEYGITEYLTLSADAPLVSMNRGFTDGFLEDYHSTFGFPNYGRETRPKNEFAYSLKKNGAELFQAKSGGLHLTDMRLSAKVSLPNAGQIKSALSYTLKVPTGDYEQGFGSNGFDHGFSLLSEFQISPFTFRLNPSVIFLSEPETAVADVSVNHSILGLFAGSEYAFSKSLNLLAQLNYYTAPFEDTGIDQLDTDSLELAVGFIYEFTPSVSLEFAFCEDLTHSAPDFNIHLGVKIEK